MSLNKDHYTIGELSHLYNLSSDTLRYYEEKGLISPSRGKNGYRYYGPQTIWRMNVIRNLRNLGFSVEYIHSYLYNRSVASTEALLHQELSDIDSKLCALQELKETVIQQLEIIEGSKDIPINEVRILQLAPRKIFEIKERYTHEEDMDLLMKRLVDQNNGQIFIIGNNRIGSVIDENSATPSFKSAIMFDANGTTILPGGTYLSICYRGPWNSHYNFAILQKYAAEHSLTLSPPYIDLVWIDIHTSNNEAEHFSEIQALVLPIKE